MFKAIRLVSIASLLLPTVSAVAGGWGRRDVAQQPNAHPPASQTALRLARSHDGLDFVHTGETLIQGAASPDLILLKNGDLLALFDYAARPGKSEPTVMGVSRSSDGGDTWSAMRPVRFKGGRNGPLQPRHGDLTRMPTGRLRLYFTTDMPGKSMARSKSAAPIALVRSAITRNGLSFSLEPRPLARVRGSDDARPLAVSFRRRVHLFLGNATAASGEGNKRPTGPAHFVSRKGRRFTQIKPASVPQVTFDGSIVALKRGLRAYVSSDDGIVSLVSRDGAVWRREAGIRLAAGWEPAVARLADGTFLMVYASPLPTDGRTGSQLVAVDHTTPDLDEWPDESATSAEEGIDESADGDSSTDLEADATDVAVTEVENADDSIATANTAGQHDAPYVSSADWRDTYDPVASEGFAPVPDFSTPVDYIDWYREFGLTSPLQNAFDSYCTLETDITKMGGEDGLFQDMFNDRDYDGPPAPWDDSSQPAWAASSDAVQPLLDRFREASQLDGYSLESEVDRIEHDSADSVPLMLDLRLPHLYAHRKLVKSIMADSWRVGADGKVSSQRMLDAWRTTYRAAAHMDSGTTLIEELVGIAERALVQKNARWALKQGIFSGSELATAFDTLRDFDRRERAPQDSLRGEHAYSMQITQYLFPPNKSGDPVLNMDRARKVVDTMGVDARVVDRFAEMSSEDVRTSVRTMDEHFRELAEKMTIGYPNVRSPDIDSIHKRRLHSSPITETILPSLSRYYQLTAREEASRRATQLAYATHLFKAKNGRFPNSLDELPAEYGQQMRTDPFTGGNFGYRLTDDGPTIYSLSENGLDDGGVHSPRWADNTAATGGSDDHVFFPPQRRR